MTEKKTREASLVIDDCWNKIGVWSNSSRLCPELETIIHCRNCPVYASVGRKLLDRPVPEEYGKEWTSVFSKISTQEKTTIRAAFVFRSGGDWLALPAKLIQEVVDMGVIHSLPHRNSNILRGVVNVRGKLELCFSIGAVLDIERFEKVVDKGGKYVSPVRLVVAEREGERIVFPVSTVYGSFRYAEGMLQQLPVTISGSKAAYTKGILCVEDFDVGLLDDQLLFDALKRNM
ncbi:MAG: chemotaxis protein CheW [Proteobacteria bacterium]|nr:chemotaxis protein CheW [Pseudomonadota bacterium]MBU1058439.1 chemotaxis protein CheW [Pseudomonadota bacterium]